MFREWKCQISYAFQQCKNFENRWTSDRVTESLKVGAFFWDTVYNSKRHTASRLWLMSAPSILVCLSALTATEARSLPARSMNVSLNTKHTHTYWTRRESDKSKWLSVADYLRPNTIWGRRTVIGVNKDGGVLDVWTSGTPTKKHNLVQPNNMKLCCSTGILSSIHLWLIKINQLRWPVTSWRYEKKRQMRWIYRPTR